jgi:hypothetical protein
MKIPTNSNVNLWFEDDLFCQINFWFVCHLLKQSNKLPSIYLVRPQNNFAYGFGGLDQKGLQEAYTHRIHLNEQTILDLSKLWAAYQSNNKTKMSKLGVKMKGELPFILEAINAHLDNQPKDGKPGRIEQTLKAIVVEHQTTAFGPVFKEFCKREPIYGLGDLQVKRILEQLLRNLS